MESLRGETYPSVFLLLVLNIDLILCQNVGPECPLLGLPQGEIFNKYSPQQPTKKVRFYPSSGLPGGPIGSITDRQRPPIQENYIQPVKQQALANLPERCPNFIPSNTQPDVSCAQETSQTKGPLFPFPPIYSPQNPAQFETLPSQSPQPFFRGIPHGPCLPLTNAPNRFESPTPERDIDFTLQDRRPSSCPQNKFNSWGYGNDKFPLLRKFFTPLVPYPNDLLSLANADALPPPFSQVTSAPLEKFNQACPVSTIDVVPIQQCPLDINCPMNNSPLNPEPEPILSSAPFACLPQIHAKEPSSVALPEIEPCPPIAPCQSLIDPFQDPASLSLCDDKSKFTRSLCPCFVPCQPSCGTCESVRACNDVCDDPIMIQIDPCLEVPVTPASILPTCNYPSCACNENVPSYSSFSPSLPLNSGCCQACCHPQPCCQPQPYCQPQPCNQPQSCFQPQPQTCYHPQPCCQPNPCCTPQTFDTPNCLGPVQPQLSCDCASMPVVISPCSSCALPSPVCLPSCECPCSSELTPINLQINVPPPTIPPPCITIINSSPEQQPTTSVESGYFDMPPMIIGGGRRKSNSWLPLIIVWLFSCGDFGYGGW